jgi:hypothetical protein
MKALFSLIVLTVSMQVFANDLKTDIVSQFKDTYRNATITSTHNKGFHMWIYAKEGNVRLALKYNRRGQVVESFRYFKTEFLSPMQALKIKNEYPDMNIHGVTEWMTGKTIVFRIILVDDEKWIHIDSDNNANFKVVHKYFKG